MPLRDGISSVRDLARTASRRLDEDARQEPGQCEARESEDRDPDAPPESPVEAPLPESPDDAALPEPPDGDVRESVR